MEMGADVEHEQVQMERELCERKELKERRSSRRRESNSRGRCGDHYDYLLDDGVASDVSPNSIGHATSTAANHTPSTSPSEHAFAPETTFSQFDAPTSGVFPGSLFHFNSAAKGCKADPCGDQPGLDTEWITSIPRYHIIRGGGSLDPYGIKSGTAGIPLRLMSRPCRTAFLGEPDGQGTMMFKNILSWDTLLPPNRWSYTKTAIVDPSPASTLIPTSPSRSSKPTLKR